MNATIDEMVRPAADFSPPATDSFTAFRCSVTVLSSAFAASFRSLSLLLSLRPFTGFRCPFTAALCWFLTGFRCPSAAFRRPSIACHRHSTAFHRGSAARTQAAHKHSFAMFNGNGAGKTLPLPFRCFRG